MAKGCKGLHEGARGGDGSGGGYDSAAEPRNSGGSGG